MVSTGAETRPALTETFTEQVGQPPAAPVSTPRKKDKEADAGPMNFANMNPMMQFFAFLFMALIGKIDPTSIEGQSVSAILGQDLGTWRAEHQNNWQETYDFKQFDFDKAKEYNERYVPGSINGPDVPSSGSYVRGGKVQIDYDGSPTAYGPPTAERPRGGKGDDHIDNAGKPGNWWGVATAGGRPVINPENGYYVSTTAWMKKGGSSTDQSSYVNAEEVPYVAATARDLARGVKYGDYVLLKNEQTGKQVWAVVADYCGTKSERNAMSEISPAAARALGVEYGRNYAKGDVSMEFFPGTALGTFPTGADYSKRFVENGPKAAREQLLADKNGTSVAPVVQTAQNTETVTPDRNGTSANPMASGGNTSGQFGKAAVPLPPPTPPAPETPKPEDHPKMATAAPAPVPVG